MGDFQPANQNFLANFGMIDENLLRKLVFVLWICDKHIEQLSYRFPIFDSFKLFDLFVNSDGSASNFHEGDPIDNIDYLLTDFFNALFLVRLSSKFVPKLNFSCQNMQAVHFEQDFYLFFVIPFQFFPFS